ncbi:hypothetical protein [Nocardia sp. NPDC058480]|uniref:hypothetical protein n=1 Tax=Nocardia sp. NPDC058480 TaxID=3346522 RepID=UPI003658CF87
MRRNSPAGHDNRGPDDHYVTPGDDNGADNNSADDHHRCGDRPGNHVEHGGSGPGVAASAATRDRGGG